MVAMNCTTIRPGRRYLSYHDAVAVASRAMEGAGAGTVLLDLQDTVETTTATLARLIVLRQELRRSGRDLLIAGLTGRAESLYQICRISRALPRSGT